MVAFCIILRESKIQFNPRLSIRMNSNQVFKDISNMTRSFLGIIYIADTNIFPRVQISDMVAFCIVLRESKIQFNPRLPIQMNSNQVFKDICNTARYFLRIICIVARNIVPVVHISDKIPFCIILHQSKIQFNSNIYSCHT